VALTRANVFVLPTMDDCFPLVLLEAMGHGKPVVTTPIGGISDIVEDKVSGLIAKAGDAQSLASTLEILMTNCDMILNLGKAGRKRLEEQFTEEVFGKRIKEMLESSLIA